MGHLELQTDVKNAFEVFGGIGEQKICFIAERRVSNEMTDIGSK
jgi:hypothetical protein